STAELLRSEPRGGVALRKPLVVEVAAVFQARERRLDVLRVFRAPPQFLAQFAGGVRPSAEHPKCVCPQSLGVQPLRLSFVHGIPTGSITALSRSTHVLRAHAEYTEIG